METSNTLTNERKYSDRKNRLHKINKMAMLYVTIIELLVIFALVIQTFVTPTSYGKLGILPLVVLVAGMIADWIIYLKEKSSERLKYVMILCYLIGWGYLMLTGTNILVTFYVFPVYAAAILYYDKRFERITFYSILTITLIRTVMWLANGYLINGGTHGSVLVSTIIGLLVISVIHATAKNAARFDDDAVFTLKDEKQAQTQMLADILQISKEVTSEVGHVHELMGNLCNTSTAVNGSVEEISVSTEVTAKSIQTQKEMTSMISDAINETARNTKIMVESAKDSSEIIAQNMKVIYDISANAESISETNSQAAGSMLELQEKAREVQQITEVIISISSQTNLLALNASIESARAGEAGRGFAVVADQIRALSEETRRSTEEITRIISELNANAENAAQIVHTSIDSMNQQTMLVQNAAESFASVQKHMDTLTGRIADIDAKIENLVQSNDTIIENINQLSTASSEVSSNAQAAANKSLENQNEAKEAGKLLDNVQALVSGFNKYQEELQ